MKQPGPDLVDAGPQTEIVDIPWELMPDLILYIGPEEGEGRRGMKLLRTKQAEFAAPASKACGEVEAVIDRSAGQLPLLFHLLWPVSR